MRRQRFREVLRWFAYDHTAGEGGYETQTGLTLKLRFILRHQAGSDLDGRPKLTMALSHVTPSRLSNIKQACEQRTFRFKIQLSKLELVAEENCMFSILSSLWPMSSFHLACLQCCRGHGLSSCVGQLCSCVCSGLRT